MQNTHCETIDSTPVSFSLLLRPNCREQFEQWPPGLRTAANLLAARRSPLADSSERKRTIRYETIRLRNGLPDHSEHWSVSLPLSLSLSLSRSLSLDISSTVCLTQPLLHPNAHLQTRSDSAPIRTGTRRAQRGTGKSSSAVGLRLQSESDCDRISREEANDAASSHRTVVRATHR